MKTALKITIVIVLVHLSTNSYCQFNETVYAINKLSTTNDVVQGRTINYGSEIEQKDAYILIRQKTKTSYYINITMRGKFALGGMYKYEGIEKDLYKYERTDGTSDGDIVYVTYPLEVLAKSNAYDQKVIMTMINYRTSFAIKLKF